MVPGKVSRNCSDCFYRGDADVREYSLLRVHLKNRDAEAGSGRGRVYGEGAEEGLQEK